MWDQDKTGVEGTAAAGDLDGNGCADLAVGVPFEDLGAATLAGAVNVLYGSRDGLSASKREWWHQDSTDIAGVAEAGDQFGRALAILPYHRRVFRIWLPGIGVIEYTPGLGYERGDGDKGP